MDGLQWKTSWFGGTPIFGNTHIYTLLKKNIRGTSEFSRSAPANPSNEPAGYVTPSWTRWPRVIWGASARNVIIVDVFSCLSGFYGGFFLRNKAEITTFRRVIDNFLPNYFFFLGGKDDMSAY